MENLSNLKILVVGVGTDSSYTISYIANHNIKVDNLLAIDTDEFELDKIKNVAKIQIGKIVTKGLATGADATKGRASAIESYEEIETFFKGFNVVFIISCFGVGGTGTGASPVIAEIAKEAGISTVCIVTEPFQSKKRKERAMDGIKKLKPVSDILIVISTSKIFEIISDNFSIKERLKLIDDVFFQTINNLIEKIIENSNTKDFIEKLKQKSFELNYKEEILGSSFPNSLLNNMSKLENIRIEFNKKYLKETVMNLSQNKEIPEKFLIKEIWDKIKKLTLKF